MDPVTTAVVHTAATEALKKESEGFLKAVLGEPAKALGGILTDRVNNRRFANLVKITVKAKRTLDEAGVSPKEVPLKIIHPMLEAASLEEDPDLQTGWANLMANAADPRENDKILPTFAAILGELTPGHALLLSSLYEDAIEKARTRTLPTEVLYDLFQLKLMFQPPKVPPGPHTAISFTNQFVVVVEVLKRHGLLTERQAASETASTQPYSKLKFSISELGMAFVRACQAPPAAAKSVMPQI